MSLSQRNEELSNIVDQINRQYSRLEFLIRYRIKSDETASEKDMIDKLRHEKPSITWFPRDQLWRLVIDGEHQENNDSLIFDKPRGKESEGEPGYLQAMEKAFLLMERSLHLPLTVKLIVALHDMSTQGVEFLERPRRSLFFSDYTEATGLRGETESAEKIDKSQVSAVQLLANNTTLAGIKEILEKYQSIATIKIIDSKLHADSVEDPKNQDAASIYFSIKEDSIVIDIDYPSSNKKYYRYDVENRKNFFETKLEYFIEEHNSQIKSANESKISIEERQIAVIKSIAEFIHKCMLLHPFRDANIRTFCFLVANRMLIENDFPPAIFENPNRFDGYHTLELCLEIISGIEKSLQIGNRKESEQGINLKALKEILTPRLPKMTEKEEKIMTELNQEYAKAVAKFNAEKLIPEIIMNTLVESTNNYYSNQKEDKDEAWVMRHKFSEFNHAMNIKSSACRAIILAHALAVLEDSSPSISSSQAFFKIPSEIAWLKSQLIEKLTPYCLKDISKENFPGKIDEELCKEINSELLKYVDPESTTVKDFIIQVQKYLHQEKDSIDMDSFFDAVETHNSLNMHLEARKH